MEQNWNAIQAEMEEKVEKINTRFEEREEELFAKNENIKVKLE